MIQLGQNFEDGVCFKLMGGFGNQLFIAAAGLSVANSLNCNLYFDKSWYESDSIKQNSKITQRNLGIDSLNFPAEFVSLPARNKFQTKIFRAQKSKQKKYFVEGKTSFPFETDRNFIGTRFEGYFQSPRYFEKISDQLIEIFQTFEKKHLNAINQILNFRSESTFIASHIRWGDYLSSSNRIYHGPISLDYSAAGIEKIRSEIDKKLETIIFTDSPKLVLENNQSISNYSFPGEIEDTNISEPATIIAMSKAAGIVISNSSFSWWAAWLLNQREEGAVVAPLPWSQSNSSGGDLILPGWFRLDKSTGMEISSIY